MVIYTDISDIKEPPVTDGQLYIYVLENQPGNNIKVGKTTNLKQRFRSLSGSNGGGNKIVRIAVSPVTYLYSIEKTVHNHFDLYRIPNTEWFNGERLTFDEVVGFVDSLFNHKSYEHVNNVRKNFVLRTLERGESYDVETASSDKKGY